MLVALDVTTTVVTCAEVEGVWVEVEEAEEVAMVVVFTEMVEKTAEDEETLEVEAAAW